MDNSISAQARAEFFYFPSTSGRWIKISLRQRRKVDFKGEGYFVKFSVVTLIRLCTALRLTNPAPEFVRLILTPTNSSPPSRGGEELLRSSR